MSVKRRLSGYSGMRVDWPHLRSIESAASFDFDSMLRGMVTGLNQPYLLRGFRIRIPNAAVSASALQVQVSDSAVLHSSAGESGTILTVPAGTADEVLGSSNSKVIGAFQNGVPNYVSLDYRRVTDSSTIDQTAGWSQAQATEFQRTAPIGRVLEYRFIISTSGFSTNLPLYIVGTTPTGAVSYISKAVPSLFRLGRGGTVPDPFYSFGYKNLSNPQAPDQPRREWTNENPSLTPNPVTVVPADPENAFDFGDWSITNLKEWMDAVMSRFKEITGSSYWYLDSSLLESSPNLFDLWWDSVGNTLTGSGYLSYNLILEAANLTYGGFQSKFTDPEILPGDSYVIGITSGNRASLQTFNFNQLVVNSLIKSGFSYGEVLYNRRIYRPLLAAYTLDDYNLGVDKLAKLARDPEGSGAYQLISSWSYAAYGPGNGALITVNYAAPHGYSVGQYLEFKDMDSATNQPIGVYRVKHVPSTTQLQYAVSVAPTGAANTLPTTGTRVDTNRRHPYMPRFNVTQWSYVATTITLTAPGHTIQSGDTIVVAGLTATSNAPNGRYASVTVNPDGTITYTAGATPTGTAGVSSANVEPDVATFLLSVTGADPDTYNMVDQTTYAYSDTDLSWRIGPSTLPALPTAAGAINLDGVVAVAEVADPAKVQQIDYDNTPIVVTGDVTGGLDTMTNMSSTVGLVPGMSISGPGLSAGTKVLNVLGPTSIQMNQVAISNQVAQNYSFSAPYLLVTTFTPHGLNTIPGPISFTIYGDQTLSPYITTYSNVSISYVSSTQFRIVGDNLTDYGVYNNPGTDGVFARYPDNPYPGPIQWDSDLFIKGVIGDRYFKIPQTATATGTPVANQFNINGLTGTAFLQDGEVAYIVLERNRSVSSGASYTTAGGGAAVIGSTPPTYTNGQRLHIGDFVKFEDEDESKWCRISNQGFSGLEDGDELPSFASTFYLISDNGQPPSLAHRPARTGRMVYSKTQYDEVIVKKHWEVDISPDVYWVAVRRDNRSLKSKVYLKALELEAGEVRQINDNEPSNLLVYTGAGTEAAINPNYSVIDQIGSYQYTQDLDIGPNVEDVDYLTRTVSFVNGPELSFQAGDRILKQVGINQYTFTVRQVISSRTVVFSEDISNLSAGDAVTYFRVNYNITDPDNLTLAIRKEDRELARVNTALTRPIYDESLFLQQINMSGTGTVKSGSYIYKGPQDAPTALAWVCHGTVSVSELVEDFNVGMPGGKFGANAVLVHMISGTFSHGDSVFQNGAIVGTRTINNAGNPPFTSPAIPAALNLEMVLPPNRRTQVIGSSYIVFPSHAIYKASQDTALAGEELMVIINDTMRQANVDYSETFGGPKGKIQILRDLPANTRMRFRLFPAYGSALSKLAGNVTLQIAYDGGNIINILPGRPVDIRVPDLSDGINLRGSMTIGDPIAGPSNSFIRPAANKAFDIGEEDLAPNKIWSSEYHTKTHSGFPNSSWTQLTAADTSVSTAAKVIGGSNITLDEGYAMRYCATFVARRSEGVLNPATEGAASFRVEGTFYREVGGSTQSAGSPISTILGAYGDGIDYAAALGMVGNDVVAVAYGASSTVEWVVTIDYQKVSLPA